MHLISNELIGQCCVVCYSLGSAYGLYPFKFVLAELVSYLGERGVLCVGNGSHLCTPVLMNMCNITYQVLRLSTFVFNKCSEKIVSIIFVVKSLKGSGWNNVGPASQTVTSALGQCIVLSGVSSAGMLKRPQHNAAVRKQKIRYITQCCFNDGPASKTVRQH